MNKLDKDKYTWKILSYKIKLWSIISQWLRIMMIELWNKIKYLLQ